jgi:hypothetical protein
MKKYALTFALVLIVIASISSQAQFAEEHRPFDFADKYYLTNGVIPELLIGRKNGADGESVFDQASEVRYSNVRITATFPGYAEDGSSLFWNYYAGVPKYGFAEDENGPRAVATALVYPMYVFPSAAVKSSDRQAALLRVDDAYFEKNPLGIAAVFLVEYTDLIYTKAGQETIQWLTERNGVSLDGTPIIRTTKELDHLIAEGFVTVTQPALDEAYRTPFAIAKAIRFPETGGITPDAFLNYVKQKGDAPLDSEQHFVSTFECLKGNGKCFWSSVLADQR